MPESRREQLHRLADRLEAMIAPTKLELSESDMDEYRRILDEISRLGVSIDGALLRDADWRPSTFLRDGPPGTLGRPARIVHRLTLVDRATPLLKALHRRIDQEKGPVNRPRDIVDARSRLLAQLIDAYLRDQSNFTLMGFLGEEHDRVDHPGFDETMFVDRSHIQALIHEGKLFVVSEGKHTTTFGIPTEVMAQYDRPSDGEMDQGEQRVDELERRVTHNYYTNVYGQANVAQGSTNVSQQLAAGVQPGDLAGLLNALIAIGLPREGAEEVIDALEADQDDDGTWRIGSTVYRVLGDVVGKAIGTGAAEGAQALWPKAMEVLQGFAGLIP